MDHKEEVMGVWRIGDQGYNKYKCWSISQIVNSYPKFPDSLSDIIISPISEETLPEVDLYRDI